MKITAIETLRTEEFANVLWVRVYTDAGIVGLGETFYGAGAVEAHLHDTLAMRLLGKNPLHIEALHREMTNLPMAQEDKTESTSIAAKTKGKKATPANPDQGGLFEQNAGENK